MFVCVVLEGMDKLGLVTNDTTVEQNDDIVFVRVCVCFCPECKQAHKVTKMRETCQSGDI